MFKRIDHIEIVPADPEKTIDFYTRILGFEVRRRHAVDNSAMREIAFLSLGDTAVEIIAARKPEPRGEADWQVGYRGLALEVEDMQRAVAYLQGRGVSLARDPYPAGRSLRAEIRDPDGLLIELRQWK